MSIRPVSPTDPVCFGVCCPQHPTCQRYAGIDTAADHILRVVSCQSGDGSRPLYIPIQAEAA